MKKGFSVEFKIILAATVVMLAFFTAVIGVQIFKDNKENMRFVYNSEQINIDRGVNTYLIFDQNA